MGGPKRLDKTLRFKTDLSCKNIRSALAEGRVSVKGVVVEDGLTEVTNFCTICLDGKAVQEEQAYYVMLHKPVGIVSATVDKEHETVISLVDAPWASELHMVGRLDLNTSGLLFLTNDGAWSRRITLPHRHVPKNYLVSTQLEVEASAVDKFARGIHLSSDNITCLPAKLSLVGPQECRVTLHEGRNHQVKRMFASIGNKVVALHRESIGLVSLDHSLQPGQWRHLTAAEVALFSKAALECRDKGIAAADHKDRPLPVPAPLQIPPNLPLTNFDCERFLSSRLPGR